MLDNDAMAALSAAFSAEATEGLSEAEEALLELERAPEEEEPVAIVFRVAHTIKGNAGVFDLQPVCALAHAMEDLLDQVRSARTEVTEALITALLESIDLLRVQIPQCLEGRAGLNDAERQLIARLEALKAGTSSEGVATRVTPGSSESSTRKETSLRVDLSTLDRLLDLSGEIGIARGRVTELIEDHAVTRETILEAQNDVGRLHVEMQELVMKLRMVPVGRTFRQLHRTVRDVARSVGKAAELAIEGEDVAVDMTVIENLRDPLVHMIRNSIGHGIETPDQRKKLGKDPIGRLVLRCSREAGSIVIELEDDGQGLDRSRIMRRALDAGLVSDGSTLSPREIDQLIFHPGFSTAEEVSSLSGRGVGMDVVRRNIEAIQGVISVSSEPGVGTTVRIRLPLTLAIIEGLLVEVAGEPYIIPMEAVDEVLETSHMTNGSKKWGDLLDFRGEAIPCLRLSTRLGVEGSPGARGENLVVVRQGAARAGLIVDCVDGECQTVVKPLARVFQGLPGFSGSSILPNGQIALILDLPTLLPSVRRSGRGTSDRQQSSPETKVTVTPETA